MQNVYTYHIKKRQKKLDNFKDRDVLNLCHFFVLYGDIHKKGLCRRHIGRQISLIEKLYITVIQTTLYISRFPESCFCFDYVLCASHILGYVTSSTNGQPYTIKINKDFLMRLLKRGALNPLNCMQPHCKPKSHSSVLKRAKRVRPFVPTCSISCRDSIYRRCRVRAPIFSSYQLRRYTERHLYMVGDSR